MSYNNHRGGGGGYYQEEDRRNQQYRGGSQYDREPQYDQRRGDDYHRGDRHGGGHSNGGNGGYNNGRGGYHQGGRDDYQRGGRDDLSQKMGRMNMNGGGRGGRGGNMYSQNGPPRPRFERNTAGLANPGDLAGSAHFPRIPVAKKDLEHNKQEFFKRPEGSVYEKKVGQKTELWTNHALVHLPSQPYLIHEYNIDVYQNRKKLEKREDAAPVFREICANGNGRRMLPRSADYIFNDVNLLWSIEKLPSSQSTVGDKRNYFVYKYTQSFEFGEGIAQRDSQFLSTLIDAIATSRVRNPKMCQNKFTVFKRSMFMIQDEKYREDFDDAPLFLKLRNGLDARMGVSIGIKLNLRAGITACYDLSHTMFTRPSYPLIRLFVELIAGVPISDEDFEDQWDSLLKSAKVTQGNRDMMKSILHKMKLCYTLESAVEVDELGKVTKNGSLGNAKQDKKDFKFFEVTEKSAEQLMFFDEELGRNISVAEFFLLKRRIRLRYPNLPCIQKKPTKMNNRFIAFPMEFVTLIAEPKRYAGLSTLEMKSEMVRWTTFTAKQRLLVLQHIIGQKKITDVPPVVDNNDRYMSRHGITIEKEMLSVKASVLPPPTVVYGGNDKFTDVHHEGEWEAVTHEPIRKVLEDAVYRRTKDKSAPKLKKRLLGSILKIGSPFNDKVAIEIDDTCYHNLMRAIESAGQPVCWENEDMGQAAIQGSSEFLQGVQKPADIYNFLHDLISNIDEKYKKSDDEVIVPLVFVIFEQRFTNIVNSRNLFRNDYNLLKYLADTQLGVFTQGMLYSTFNTIGSTPATCKFTRLIVEKVLGKVGTTHRKLESGGTHKSWTKVTNPKEPTLFLGVDVSHPSTRDLKDPESDVKKMSVATVVGNIDIDCTEYRASSKIQSVGEERIVRFQDEIQTRIADFTMHNSIRPAHIVVYRDGLSEGDFQRTLYEERIAIENACIALDIAYQPSITYIVVTKRHHTRFFLKDESEGIEEQGFNVRPGTLVEDTVTTNNYYDFYLTTQVGQMGLARPTHYYVLWNTWPGCLPTFWPTVTHALTYMFCRATSTVALPAPVLYAHLASKRAKETMDGAIEAHRLMGRAFNMDVYSDVAELTKQINNHPELDGMVFV
ncbi:hypothetical protein GCK72_019143 [Caenorhabditis remanei]|uniref:Uncharacterized protein n=1 Tax=Caenorhabditis remanei TaxID=31234 RepID=A0A6A5GBU9_CAERE|nr:hypothetical protein GCK72_019143 [Caenorhabditis remanei]KAF1752588.1 hypothetical protein GCK72_019143 [Caenorhabditis remanei]